MVTHLSIIHGFGSSTSVIWPFTLTALIVASCLRCALLRHLNSEFYFQFFAKKQTKNKTKFSAHLSLKWVTFAHYQHKPKVKAVRVNGWINKVKQP